MKSITQQVILTELRFRNALIKKHDSLFNHLKNDRGDVPGWVLVVLMTTGLVTAISAGIATITAQAALNNQTVTANSAITVNNPQETVSPPPTTDTNNIPTDTTNSPTEPVTQ